MCKNFQDVQKEEIKATKYPRNRSEYLRLNKEKPKNCGTTAKGITHKMGIPGENGKRNRSSI